MKSNQFSGWCTPQKVCLKPVLYFYDENIFNAKFIDKHLRKWEKLNKVYNWDRKVYILSRLNRTKENYIVQVDSSLCLIQSRLCCPFRFETEECIVAQGFLVALGGPLVNVHFLDFTEPGDNKEHKYSVRSNWKRTGLTIGEVVSSNFVSSPIS